MIESISRHLMEYTRQREHAGEHEAQRTLLEAMAVCTEQDWLECARALVLRGHIETARAVLLTATIAYRESVDLRFALAGILHQGGESTQAEKLLRELLAEQPTHAAAALLLAQLLRVQGRMCGVATVLNSLLEHGRLDLATVIQCVELLDDCGRKKDAANLCENEISAGSADPRIHAYAGMLEVQLGEFDRARLNYEFALKHNSQALEWNIPIGLSSMQRYRDASHPDFELFRDASQQTGLSSNARTGALFALGKAHDDIGDYAQAARYWAEANAMVRLAGPWPRKQWRRRVESRLAGKPLSLQLTPTAEWIPVFVVGVPRSGTTLVAELLSRHPSVCNRGELDSLSTIAQSLSLVDERKPGAFEQAAKIYAAQLRQDDSGAHWFIDKQPLNLFHIDLILALWPRARIIHCQRNQRDTALSLWGQPFLDKAQGYAYDFASITTVINDCARLMTHWKKRHASSIYSINYEQLVTDPDASVMALSHWLALPESDRSGAQGTTNAISSASLWQARQPVYNRSVNRWKHYASYLPELLRVPDN